MAKANELVVKIKVSIRSQVGLWIAAQNRIVLYERAKRMYLLERDELLFRLPEKTEQWDNASKELYVKKTDELYQKHLAKFEIKDHEFDIMTMESNGEQCVTKKS